MLIARKTLEAIDNAIAADGGARWRGLLRATMRDLDDAYRDKQENFRSHLGASLAGRECARELWYNFRWTSKASFGPRMLRLFNRGHLEEGRFAALLQLIGMEVAQYDETGKQYRISGAEGHYGGSGDGVALNCPDLPGERILTEFKTHNDKSFAKLIKEGVRKAKPEHWAQCQQYMRKFGIRYTLYGAVNKNDDALHMEIIVLDEAAADLYIERAEKIVWLKEPPPKIGNPPSVGNFACRFCDYRPVCHLEEEPSRNCRTCAHASPCENKQWHCSHWNNHIPKDFMEQGCDQWTKHPGFKN